MLTKKQTKKLDAMEKKYLSSMIGCTSVPYALMRAWAKQYRVAMERVLQKQCKH